MESFLQIETLFVSVSRGQAICVTCGASYGYMHHLTNKESLCPPCLCRNPSAYPVASFATSCDVSFSPEDLDLLEVLGKMQEIDWEQATSSLEIALTQETADTLAAVSSKLGMSPGILASLALDRLLSELQALPVEDSEAAVSSFQEVPYEAIPEEGAATFVESDDPSLGGPGNELA